MNDNVNRLGHTLANCEQMARTIALELAALKLDAERYRWLCSLAWGAPAKGGYGTVDLKFLTFRVEPPFTWDTDNDSKPIVDAAIDAARKP